MQGAGVNADAISGPSADAHAHREAVHDALKSGQFNGSVCGSCRMAADGEVRPPGELPLLSSAPNSPARSLIWQESQKTQMEHFQALRVGLL